MSEKPKKKPNMNPPQNNHAELPQYTVGTQVMAKTNALNAQWQVCKMLEGGIVEFPDGSQYPLDDVQIGGQVAQAAPLQPLPAATMGQMNPGYDAFRNDVVQLDAIAQQSFQMPLEAVLMMARRQALTGKMASTGVMDVIGGQALFVPDTATLAAWLDAYLAEVQRREQGGSPE